MLTLIQTMDTRKKKRFFNVCLFTFKLTTNSCELFFIYTISELVRKQTILLLQSGFFISFVPKKILDKDTCIKFIYFHAKLGLYKIQRIKKIS